MDDCPISFGARAQLPLNPGFVSGAWQTDPPGISVQIIFDTMMNTTVVPDASSFQLLVDTNPIVVSDFEWLSPTVLAFDTEATSDPSSTLTIELLTEDPNLHSLSGMRPVLPFGPSDIFFAI